MATKNNPGDYDCYANADPDEPMFVLLGRDRHGGDTVRYWISRREAEDNPNEKKLTEARACADAMDKWAVTHAAPTAAPPVAPEQDLFDTADYYDCRDSEELTYETPEEAIEAHLDDFLDPKSDVAAVIRDKSPITVTAYTRKVVDPSLAGALGGIDRRHDERAVDRGGVTAIRTATLTGPEPPRSSAPCDR